MLFIKTIRKPKLSLESSLLFYILAMFYILLTAALYHASEQTLPKHLLIRTKLDLRNQCIGNYGYMKSLYFAISTSSMIGVGSIYPCTTMGQFLSVICPFIGLPLLMKLLADLGDDICVGQRNLIRRFQHATGFKLRLDQELFVHFALQVVVISCCITLLAFYLNRFESHRAYEALYLSCLTFVTGDLIIEHYIYTPLIFTVVFGGFSTYATMLFVFRQFMREMKQRVKADVQRQLEMCLRQGQPPDENYIQDVISSHTGAFSMVFNALDFELSFEKPTYHSLATQCNDFSLNATKVKSMNSSVQTTQQYACNALCSAEPSLSHTGCSTCSLSINVETSTNVSYGIAKDKKIRRATKETWVNFPGSGYRKPLFVSTPSTVAATVKTRHSQTHDTGDTGGILRKLTKSAFHLSPAFHEWLRKLSR